MGAASISNSESSRVLTADSAQWPQISSRTVEQIAILADAIAIVAACVVWGAFLTASGGRTGLLASLGMSPLVCALFIPAAKLGNLYHHSTVLSGTLYAWNVAALWLGVVALLGLAAVAFEVRTPPQASIAFALLGLLGLLSHRTLCRLFIRKALAGGTLRGRKIVLISEAGASSHPGGVSDLQRHGLQIEHNLHFGSLADDAPVKQRIDHAIALSIGSNIDELVIAADVQRWPQLKPHLARLRQLPLPVSLMASGCLAELITQPSYTIGSSILIEVQRPPLGLAELLVKRSMDLTCAAFGILMLLPLLALVALLIKLDSPGPVLFRQTRLGFNGKPFTIYKFRTMTALEDGAEVRQATREDERVTNVGRWLRRASIDELPQLFNVLKGDMSIVGPRPHAVAHDDQFGRLITDYAFRRRMKPGITGWAQVNGYRGATPKLDLMDHRVRLDRRYIEKWSIWLDIGIVARTLVEVIRGRNAY